MNELIEELWVKFSYDTDISFYGETPESIEELMDYHDFKQAIQIACKAQRNACYRKYEEKDIGISILTAEIERQDYE